MKTWEACDSSLLPWGPQKPPTFGGPDPSLQAPLHCGMCSAETFACFSPGLLTGHTVSQGRDCSFRESLICLVLRGFWGWGSFHAKPGWPTPLTETEPATCLVYDIRASVCCFISKLSLGGLCPLAAVHCLGLSPITDAHTMGAWGDTECVQAAAGSSDTLALHDHCPQLRA